MKQLVILLAFVAFGKIAMAQKDSLAVDEHGKYIYYKVVQQDKFGEDSLCARAALFFKTAYPKTELKLVTADAGNKAFTAHGLFTVSDRNSLSKHDDGQVTYSFNLEIKDRKYRYWLTNFVYTPFYRDRYNNFVPQPGMDMPLEQASKHLDSKQLNIYLNETGTYGIRLGSRLKWYMQHENTVKRDTAKKVIIINKW